MHPHFSEFNHNAGTAMSRYIIHSTCVTTKLTQNYKVTTFLRADVSKYRPEVYKSEKSKILKKIHKVALGKLLT